MPLVPGTKQRQERYLYRVVLVHPENGSETTAGVSLTRDGLTDIVQRNKRLPSPERPYTIMVERTELPEDLAWEAVR